MAWLGTVEAPARDLAALLPAVSFNPRGRQVSNWHLEAALHVEASAGVTAGLILGRDPGPVTRCVRLNNYWCIKRAGWAGEIAADAEGHVAFASAAEGADVAALLLRRYYVDYGRHSARAIVSHWAPASCGPAAAGARSSARGRIAPSAADHLTTHGVGRTLRARFLASRGRRVVGAGRLRGRVSAVPDRLIGARTATPSIVAVFGEPPLDLGTRSLASLPLAALGAPPPAPSTAEPQCAGDEARIAAYAAKTAAGAAAGPDADLKLFDAAGAPTPNLARVMHNMSAVEIGPLGARQGLVGAAVEHAKLIAAAATAPAGNAFAKRRAP